MASRHSYPKTSVVDSAMEILESMSGSPKENLKDFASDAPAQASIVEAKGTSDIVPDVSDQEVTDDFVSLILEGKPAKRREEQKPVVEEQEVPINEAVTSLRNAVRQLAEAIAQAKKVLQEMTTAGMIGTGGSKGNNPWAICTKSTGRKNKDKYERCVKKVKRKL